MTKIVKLKTEFRPRTTRVPGKKAAAALLRQKVAAGAIGAVGVTLTALSLSHLASGIALVTGSSGVESWAMASGIDLGFIALEAAQLTVGARLLKRIDRYTRPAILGTLAGSAAMNAMAFAAHATTYATAAGAVALGLAIPALIYVLMRVGAALYIDGQGRV